jgi:hypothetical protein
LWSWIKEIGVPCVHTRACSPHWAGMGRGRGRDVTCRVESSGRTGDAMCCGREHRFAVDDSLMLNITVGCWWTLNRDNYSESLTATITTWGAVNTKNCYREETDMWAEFGRRTPFGRRFSSKHSVEASVVGSTLSFGKRAIPRVKAEAFGSAWWRGLDTKK